MAVLYLLTIQSRTVGIWIAVAIASTRNRSNTARSLGLIFPWRGNGCLVFDGWGRWHSVAVQYKALSSDTIKACSWLCQNIEQDKIYSGYSFSLTIFVAI